MKLGFVMEGGLGQRVFRERLRRYIRRSRLPTHARVFEAGDPPRLLASASAVQNDLTFRFSVDGLLQILRAGLLWRADCIVVHSYMPAFLGVPLVRELRDVPFVISVDGTPKQLADMGREYGLDDQQISTLRRDDRHSAFERLFDRAARMVAFSQWAARSLIEDYGVDEASVVVAPPGLDVDAWKPSSEVETTSQDLPTELDEQGGDVLNVLFVGGDFRRKGGETVLKWAQQYDGAPCRLSIATLDDVRVPDLDRVNVYRGLEPNSQPLKSLYHRADLFFYPTIADMSPHVLLEAMATATPIVTTDVGGVRELVGPDGRIACINDPEDTSALCAAVDCLIRHPKRRRRMAKRARKRAVLHFDISSYYRRVTDLVTEVVS